jgi:hypothetical protein
MLCSFEMCQNDLNQTCVCPPGSGVADCSMLP